MNRRHLLRTLLGAAVAANCGFLRKVLAGAVAGGHDPADVEYGMAIDVDRCIGCGRCMEACKTENQVPPEPYYVRTWVERYLMKGEGEVVVTGLQDKDRSGEGATEERDLVRSFFVPKLCNHCENPPCVQVCPVGATFRTTDGVILVDDKRCIGCRYCIQACPYGARYLHPGKRTADKCTFCYHRVARELLPACVEVCPTQARLFGNRRSPASPLTRFRRMNKIHVLKPYLNTDPVVVYANLDGVVS